MDINKLNHDCWEIIERYRNLDVYGKKVCTPYFINNAEKYFTQLMNTAGIPSDSVKKVGELYNNREVPYGWYRGKGAPKQISESIEKISEIVGFTLDNLSVDAIQEYMKIFGVGIDCSGFVYNVLSFAFGKTGLLEKFNNSLAWLNPEKQGPTRAGVFVFSGEASDEVKIEDLRSLDVILVKNIKGAGGYSHMMMILEGDNGLNVAQSTLSIVPAGVHIEKLEEWKVSNEDRSDLEFRRLKILDNE
ncbi:MAG: hypothetical protein AAB546_02245 [Patescibacteria group bacterium]